MAEEKKETEKKDYITIYRALFGWKAVWVTWTVDEHGGFWEPEQTGVGTYDDPAKAEVEAKQWAEDEALVYVPCSEASN